MTARGTSRLVAQVLLLVGLTASARAQGAPCAPVAAAGSTFSGYRFYEENDSIFKDGGDERYTQGLRVEIGYRHNKVPCFAQRVDEWLKKLWRRPELSQKGFGLVLGQTLYTPRIITTVDVEPNDRSFTDFSYVGAQFSTVANDRTLRHTLEVDFGLLGRPGLGKGAQGGLHALKLDRIPKGWDTTDPRRVGINAYYRLDKRVTHNKKLWPPCPDIKGKPTCLFDITFGHAAELGNVRTSYGWHAAFRGGFNLTGLPASTIPLSADHGATRRLEVGAIVAFEARAIAYTALVQPTPGTEGFSTSPFVLDQRYGLYARYQSFRVTLQRVKRSHEFSIGDDQRSQTFASLSASYEPDRADAPSAKGWFLRNWQIELGMGANFGGPKISEGNDHGLGSQLALRKGLIERGPWLLVLGLWDWSVATVETTPTPGEPGNHSDLFLQQKAVTLGLNWSPSGGKYGRLGARAGTALWGGVAQVETIFHQPEDGKIGEQKLYRDFEAPRGGWLVGAQYFLPLERHLTLGTDVAYHSVKVTEPVPALVEPTFWKWILAVQLRP